MRKTSFWKRISAAFLAAALCMGSLPAGAQEVEGTAMGRYLEEDLTLPEEDFMAYDIVCTKEGTLRVVGNGSQGYGLWDSTDGGATWEQTGTFPKEYDEAFFLTMSLSPVGGGVAVNFDVKLDEDGNAEEERLCFLSFDSQGTVKETEIGVEYWLSNLEFTRDGSLVGVTNKGGAYLVDPTTGEALQELAASEVEVAGVSGSEALLIGNGTLRRYDLAAGEPLEGDAALEEMLFSLNQTYEPATTYGQEINFAEDEEGRLYFVTRQGIYSHVMGGGTVEQVVDGTLNTLSDPANTLIGMAVQNQIFYVLCMDGNGKTILRRYAYDAAVASVPERELTIYSLHQDDAVTQAAVMFQKEHPDTFVNYQVGLSGTDGVTVSDALRTLNTDILAGNGPDILVLDGMSVATYAEQGLLTDLAPILKEMDDQEGLLENIVYGYQQGEMVPAVPTRFAIPMVAGAKNQVEAFQSISQLPDFAGETGAMIPSEIIYLPERLYPFYAARWQQEDGTMNQEVLTEYLQCIRQSYENFQAAADEQDLEMLSYFQQTLAEVDPSRTLGLYYYLDPYGFDAFQFLQSDKGISFGMLCGIMDYAALSSVNVANGNCSAKVFYGQEPEIYLPLATMGILSSSKEQEAAADFLKFLLSEKGQLATISGYAGFAVNEKAFQENISAGFGENEGMTASAGNSNGEMLELEYTWPTKEEQETLTAGVAKLKQPGSLEEVPRNTVIGEARRCMYGEISAEEAASSIMQKINLYLAEG